MKDVLERVVCTCSNLKMDGLRSLPMTQSDLSIIVFYHIVIITTCSVSTAIELLGQQHLFMSYDMIDMKCMRMRRY